jgi:hypothetical protein
VLRAFLISTVLLLGLQRAMAEEPAEGSAAEAKASEATEAAVEEQGDGLDKPKTLSGMSILGNEEAPKSLVIIPWKSSELGDDISLSDTLDDRARPVDKDVFLRELSYYEIRSGK